MNDFFSNLIARSFTHAPVIQPRLPSLFETPAKEFSDERQLSSPAVAATEATARSAALGVTFKAQARSTRDENAIADAFVPSAKEHSTQSDWREQKRAALIARTSSVEHAAPARELDVQRKGIIVPLHSVADREKDDDERGRVSESHSQRRSVQQRVRRDVSTADQRSSTSPPVIRVTIGRVEVRAIQAATPPAQPVKRPSPRLSLEDYLRKNERGPR